MWDYINEQKDVLTNILDYHKEMFSPYDKDVFDIEEIIITASGSSLNAAMLVKAMCEKESDKRIIIENPFQLRYYSPLLKQEKKAILIVLSQTGKSVGTLECLKIAKTNHIPTIAITAYNDSPIAKEADYHINMRCGDEPVGPKTKGFSATVMTLHLFIMKIIHSPLYQDVIKEYRESINELPQNIKDAKAWCQEHENWSKAKAMSIVGFGVNYPTAREGSLKVLETMQISVMNFDMEEFMHGPHRTIVKDSYLAVIDTDGYGKTLMNNLIEFSKTKTGNYFIVSTLKPQDEHTIHIGNYPLTSSWLNAVIPFQVMCTYFPQVNGVNSSDPVYGEFATTVGTRIA